MIYLLGGSGYVGTAYQDLLTRKGLAFRSIRRADLDYTQVSVLREALLRDKPQFLINAAGYTGKPNVDACELHKAECLHGNAVLPGVIQTPMVEASFAGDPKLAGWATARPLPIAAPPTWPGRRTCAEC